MTSSSTEKLGSTEQELQNAELAFKLALDHLFSAEAGTEISTWHWLVINQALCTTTSQLARHKNLLKNLKYRLALSDLNGD